MVIFRKIVIIVLGRNTPNNSILNVTNKKTKKVTWKRCYPSTTNLEQLKGQSLVLTLVSSYSFFAIFHLKSLQQLSCHENILIILS